MILHPPFIIGARLTPALKIGDTYLSFDGSVFIIDMPGLTYEVTDYGPGAFHDTQECFKDILCFMQAAAESRGYRLRTGKPGDNEDLFPPHIVDWIVANKDEIEGLACELEADDFLIEE